MISQKLWIWGAVFTLALAVSSSHQHTELTRHDQSLAPSPDAPPAPPAAAAIGNEDDEAAPQEREAAAAAESSMAEAQSQYFTLADLDPSQVDIEVDVHPDMLPCKQTQPWGDCGMARVNGVHCPAGYCCSKTAIRGGMPPTMGHVCVQGFVFCSTPVVYMPYYSYGSCKCSAFGNKCPPNSECHDTPKGPFCRCKKGYFGENGTCFPGP